MNRCKYISKAEIESRGLYNFCETLLVFEDPEVRDRMTNKRKIEILTNACFFAFSHTEELVSVEQSIKSKTAQAMTSENKTVVMMDCLGNRSNSFDMQIADTMFDFCHVYIDTSQWNCCHVQHNNSDFTCIGTHIKKFDCTNNGIKLACIKSVFYCHVYHKEYH